MVGLSLLAILADGTDLPRLKSALLSFVGPAMLPELLSGAPAEQAYPMLVGQATGVAWKKIKMRRLVCRSESKRWFERTALGKPSSAV